MAKASSETAENWPGIVTEVSSRSAEEVVQSLEALLKQKGIKLFTIVDHSGEAEKAALKMPPTKLLIFGNPKVGTPAMLASPSSALDLPLKILVAEDEQGVVHISYNSLAYLQERHAIPQEASKSLGSVADLVKSIL